MEEEQKTFLGTGWAFPPEFSADPYGARLVSDEEDIRQSLLLLLSTTPGERIMRPKYGCDLMSVVFNRLTAATESQIVDMVTMAVLRFEPRVTLEEVRVEASPAHYGMIRIQLDYTIRRTNTRENVVFPFYLQEGTNIEDL